MLSVVPITSLQEKKTQLLSVLMSYQSPLFEQSLLLQPFSFERTGQLLYLVECPTVGASLMFYHE